VDRRRQVLNRLNKAWIAFNESYAGLSDAQMIEPGVTGASSVRDTLAHVTSAEACLSFWAREQSPSAATRGASLPPTPRAAWVDLQHCIVELI
jgi:hypothetical protein